MNTTKRRQMDFGGSTKAMKAGAAFSARHPCRCGHDELGHDGKGCVLCGCKSFSAASLEEPAPDPKRAAGLLAEADRSRPGADLR